MSEVSRGFRFVGTAGLEPATTLLSKKALYPLSYVVGIQIVSLGASDLGVSLETNNSTNPDQFGQLSQPST
jgi:hypothetical protein